MASLGLVCQDLLLREPHGSQQSSCWPLPVPWCATSASALLRCSLMSHWQACQHQHGGSLLDQIYAADGGCIAGLDGCMGLILVRPGRLLSVRLAA